MNLLLVNDEVYTAEAMKELIPWGQYGIDNVYIACSAAEGKELIARQNVDIMLCDIEMPGENGIELLRWVRQRDRRMKCIVLTCHASFAYAQEAISLDCQDYILMPAKYEQIGEAVYRAVKRIRQERQEGHLRDYARTALQQNMDDTSSVDESHKDPQQIVRAVRQVVMERLQDEELSVSSIASSFYLHPVYLNRIFKREMGIPISQYILDTRMYMAAQLLKEEQMGANAVAARLGYKSYSNFYSAFKKYYGYTPTQFAEEKDKV